MKGAVGRRLTQALVEQAQQEQPVEAVKVAGAPLLPYPFQAVAQVVRVVVKEVVLLDEVDEHHPIEHERAYHSRSATFVMPLMKPRKAVCSFLNRS